MSESKLRRLRDRAGDAATLINRGCRISGLISGAGNYHISGTIDGDCDIDGTVTLAPDGHWQGTIRAEAVIISGHVDGDIVATGKVEISASARISGTVTAEAIAMAEGAVVEGMIQTTGKNEPLTFVEKRNKDG